MEERGKLNCPEALFPGPPWMFFLLSLRGRSSPISSAHGIGLVFSGCEMVCLARLAYSWLLSPTNNPWEATLLYYIFASESCIAVFGPKFPGAVEPGEAVCLCGFVPREFDGFGPVHTTRQPCSTRIPRPCVGWTWTSGARLDGQTPGTLWTVLCWRAGVRDPCAWQTCPPAVVWQGTASLLRFEE